MNIKITKKYLVFPINTFLPKKEMRFKRGNNTVYRLDIKLDNYNPNFYAYIDVSGFFGEEIEIVASSETEISLRETDLIDIENLYGEPFRPQVHFTAKKTDA